MKWRDYQKRQKVCELGPRFVSYIDEGAGAPVIFIHGIPTWGYLFHTLVGELARIVRVLVPDLLGFGFSDKSDSFDRSIAQQTEALVSWMDALAIDSATVIGHDIGGGVALRLATLFPARVNRLCVMNSVCYDSWPIEMMLQLGHPVARRMASASATLTLLKQGLKLGFGTDPGDDILDGLLAPYRTEVGKTSLIRNAVALNTNLTTEITHLLPTIRMPSLILWGEDDKFQSVQFGERLAWDIPKATLVRVPGARHFVMIDQPQIVAQELRRFVDA